MCVRAFVCVCVCVRVCTSHESCRVFSYMDGLIPILDRFVTDPDIATNVSSVIPGRIYVVKGERFLLG